MPEFHLFRSAGGQNTGTPELSPTEITWFREGDTDLKHGLSALRQVVLAFALSGFVAPSPLTCAVLPKHHGVTN